MPTRSYLSQVERPLTFGLAASESVESIRIIWPDGSVQQAASIPVDQLTVIRQADPTP
jgi:hypothetical protein